MKYEHAFAKFTCILSNFTSFEHLPYHSAFDNETVIISDPTLRSDPLEVDFYRVGERVEGTGPFGVMHPLQEPKGSGMFRCDRSSEDAGYSHIHTHCNKNSTNG